MYWSLDHLYKLNLPVSQIYTPFGIMQMINGLILDRIAFDTFS